ncbi:MULTISPECIES: hypothetical protein [Streptomyces]|uniref:hypothetical protein n=1 Tax=Streptomyces TaxID=1883 RepID=UPI00131E7877|nr:MULTISPECIES: hypothetical protein [Streptomyces]MDI5907804.1 hypothetical protein [Streptomyces sp. 12257]
MGVAASAAGVLAGVLLVVDRWGPKEISLADWRTKANAVCDRSFNLSSALSTWNSFQQFAYESDSLSSSQFQSQREKVARELDQLGDRVRQGKAGLSGIGRPKGNKEEVDKLVASLDRSSEMIFQIAYDLRNTVDQGEVENLFDEALEETSAVGSEQRDLFKKLGAEECYVESGS